jgi:hypothetical protein
VLCHAFRRGDLPEFFATARPGRREQPKKSRAHDQIVALRKRNYSVYEISQALKEQGMPLSATAVREVLAAEGFAPLPRRLDEERPDRIGPSAQAVANINDFVLGPREFTTRTGGLFLFVPDLVRLDADVLARDAKLPGSRMIPAAHALRASLALKLWAIERKSHIMALVADEGWRSSAASTPCPRRASCRNTPRASPRRRSRACSPCGTDNSPEKISSPAPRSTSISTPCRISASIPSSNPIIWRSEVAGSPASSPSWLRMPTAKCSATRMPTFARARKPRRFSASSSSGPDSTAARRSTSSSTPSSPPMAGSIDSTQPGSPS